MMTPITVAIAMTHVAEAMDIWHTSDTVMYIAHRSFLCWDTERTKKKFAPSVERRSQPPTVKQQFVLQDYSITEYVLCQSAEIIPADSWKESAGIVL